MKTEQSDRNIRKVFLAYVPVQALSVAIPGINSLLNSVIISKFFGTGALAAVGFVAPFVNIVTAVSAVMSSGAQILCGRYLGRGDRKSIRDTFTTSMLMCGFFGLLFSLTSLIFPTVAVLLLGATGEMTKITSRYFLGMAPGYFFNVLFTCMLPFLQMDNSRALSVVAVVASLVTTVIFNLVNATVLNLGLLGVGLAASAGSLASLVICLPHFIFKSDTYRFSLKGFSVKTAGNIIKQGYPASVNSVALALRDRVLNQVLFTLGGSVAMSALTVANNMTAVLVSINGGYGGSASLISSVLVGERDAKSLRRMTRTAFKSLGWLFYAAYGLLFVLTKPIATLFGAEPENLGMYVMAIRLVNMFMMTNAIKEVPLSLYRSMGKINLTSLFFALNGLIYPLLIITLFRNCLPVLLAVSPLSELLMFLTYAVYFRIKAHRFPRSLLNMTYVPDSLGVPGKNCYSATVQNPEETVRVSGEICGFCERKGMPGKASMFCGLCFEEMSMNILQHGFPDKHRQEYAVDVRLIYEDNGVSMMIRDNCPNFDPTEWLKMYSGDDPTHSIGIRLVSRIATRMEYSDTLGMNVMNIRLEAPHPVSLAGEA